MEALITLLFIPFFVLLWVGVTGLISVIGGWHGLAQSNPVPQALYETGDVYSFQSVRLGFLGNYNSTVNITIYSQGIRIVPIILFSLFHKPIYITYNAMRNVAYGRFILHYMTFNVVERKVMIMGKSVLKLKEKIGSN